MSPMRLSMTMVICFVILVTAVARAEVATIQLVPGTWTIADINFGYQDLPVQLGFGVAAVDSVHVELFGVSHLGELPLGCHPECMSVPCNESVVAGFQAEDDPYNCQNWYSISCDSPMSNCMGAAFLPLGDLQEFDLERKVTGLSVNCGTYSVNFPVTDVQPDLGTLFADGYAVLRLRRVFGNYLSTRCFGGTADINRVDVHVYFDAALPVDTATWGTIKARYR